MSYLHYQFCVLVNSLRCLLRFCVQQTDVMWWMWKSFSVSKNFKFRCCVMIQVCSLSHADTSVLWNLIMLRTVCIEWNTMISWMNYSYTHCSITSKRLKLRWNKPFSFNSTWRKKTNMLSQMLLYAEGHHHDEEKYNFILKKIWLLIDQNMTL